MADQLEVTVGPRRAHFVGSDHRVLQAAVDYVTRLGGGTVRLRPGTYRMGNSLFLRDRLRLVGAGEETILRKGPSAATPLVDDTDWYDTWVHVKDASTFAVGGAILLRGRSPHFDKQQFVKRTVTAIEGNAIRLDRDPRENFWIDMAAEAATLFPLITGDYVNDVAIEDLVLDGNRAENENLNGNYGGGIFIQDCDRVVVRGVVSRDNNSDGISWQVCDDVTVEGCRLLNNTDLGLHAGSGSQRSLVRGNTVVGGSVGFFFCWGVRHALVEGNLIQDCDTGISIGHRDTDNVVRGNTVRRSRQRAILFREHPVALRDPHRNVFEGNLLEDWGQTGECVAIDIQGAPQDVVLGGNHVGDARRRSTRRTRIGIRVGPRVGALRLSGNTYSGVETQVLDLRA